MSAIDRRTVLKAGAGVSAVGAIPLVADRASAATRLVVFDSAIAESRDFAVSVGGGERLDLASEHRGGWKRLRGSLPAVERIDGLTGWSDLVAIRSELERMGMRLDSQQPVAAPLSRKAHLFRWSMKAR